MKMPRDEGEKSNGDFNALVPYKTLLLLLLLLFFCEILVPQAELEMKRRKRVRICYKLSCNNSCKMYLWQMIIW